MGLFGNKKNIELDKSLNVTKENFLKKLTRIVAGKSKVDDEVLDNLEEVLLSSDVGVETTLKIIKKIEHRVAQNKYIGSAELNMILKEEVTSLLEDNKNFIRSRIF